MLTPMMEPEAFGDSSQERPSPSAQPIAIVGMACRFPGAPDISAFRRLLEAGQNAVSEGVPGSGEGRWGQLFPDDTVQSEGCRYGAMSRCRAIRSSAAGTGSKNRIGLHSAMRRRKAVYT